MNYPLLQKFFRDSSSGATPWLAELMASCQADSATAERVTRALELFAQFGPRVEEEAFSQADARLRHYQGMETVEEHRATVEAVYVAAAYSKLALTLALALGKPTTRS